MTDRIRIIKHEAIPGYGSFEVKIEGQPSKYFTGTTFHPAGSAPIRWTARPRWIGQGCGKES
jgi:hypothetical protein